MELRRIHLRVKCFSNNNKKKSFVSKSCSSSSVTTLRSIRKQFSTLVFHTNENGLYLPLMTMFLGTTVVVQSSKQMPNSQKSRRDITAQCHLVSSETFPYLNYHVGHNIRLRLGHHIHTVNTYRR